MEGTSMSQGTRQSERAAAEAKAGTGGCRNLGKGQGSVQPVAQPGSKRQGKQLEHGERPSAS